MGFEDLVTDRVLLSVIYIVYLFVQDGVKDY